MSKSKKVYAIVDRRKFAYSGLGEYLLSFSSVDDRDSYVEMARAFFDVIPIEATEISSLYDVIGIERSNSIIKMGRDIRFTETEVKSKASQDEDEMDRSDEED